MLPDSEFADMHGRVVEWLGSQIAKGTLRGILDLGAIAEEFHVSRSLVRECLRTLSAKGMVRARQRTGTSVTEPEHWALLDEQVIRWRAAGPRRFVQLEESLELRSRLEPLAASLTAQRGDAETLAAIDREADQIDTAIRTDDGRLMIEADTAFHRLLYLGSGNSMLARLAGTVHACLRVPDLQDYARFSPDTVARHWELADLIRSGEAAAAERRTEVMMAISRTLFTSACRQIADQGLGDPGRSGPGPHMDRTGDGRAGPGRDPLP